MTTPFAFVFPGQGSQKIGMLGDLAGRYPAIGESFAEASEALGEDLWKLAQEGPAEEINKTANTQPVLLAASVAMWRAWSGARPAVLAGHSLGEYSALVAAGSVSLADGIRVVRARGEFMQDAVAPGAGAMAAVIGLDDDAIVAACEAAAEGEVVSAVNFNAPGQVVIAGAAAAVERAMEKCKAAGARRCMPLPVSVPSHCALMRPAAERLAEALADVAIAAPEIPVIHNVDAQPASDPDAIRDRLVRQLHSPVLWVDSVRAMAGQGVTALLECGPGKVLTGLNKRIVPDLNTDALEDPERFSAYLDELA